MMKEAVLDAYGRVLNMWVPRALAHDRSSIFACC